MKKYISIFSVFLLVSLTSCFEEYDEGYDLVGRVASIPVFTVSANTAPVGGTVTANFRYYSEHEPVTELRLIQRINGQYTVADSKEVTGHDVRNSYEDSFVYTVPQADVGVVITLQIEVVTANGLTNRGMLSRNVTVGAPAD